MRAEFGSERWAPQNSAANGGHRVERGGGFRPCAPLSQPHALFGWVLVPKSEFGRGGGGLARQETKVFTIVDFWCENTRAWERSSTPRDSDALKLKNERTQSHMHTIGCESGWSRAPRGCIVGSRPPRKVLKKVREQLPPRQAKNTYAKTQHHRQRSKNKKRARTKMYRARTASRYF